MREISIKIELESSTIKYFYSIMTIEFYKDVMRIKDTDGIIIHVPLSNIKNITINTIENTDDTGDIEYRQKWGILS